jgi:hypothetical protein
MRARECTVDMDITSPIVVDLGKTHKKNILQLYSGAGPLADDVHQAMRRVRASAGSRQADRIFVPVVVIYKSLERDQGESVNVVRTGQPLRLR